MSTKKEPRSIMEELRAIRDRLSLKLLKMSPEEQVAYINSQGQWFEEERDAQKSKRLKPRPASKRPTTKRRSPKAKDNA